jgi:hypothetical protein
LLNGDVDGLYDPKAKKPEALQEAPASANKWSKGTETQSARAPGAAASARSPIAVVGNSLRRRRALFIQRRPQGARDLEEATRAGLPDDLPQSRLRNGNSDACPFKDLRLLTMVGFVLPKADNYANNMIYLIFVQRR